MASFLDLEQEYTCCDHETIEKVVKPWIIAQDRVRNWIGALTQHSQLCNTFLGAKRAHKKAQYGDDSNTAEEWSNKLEISEQAMYQCSHQLGAITQAAHQAVAHAHAATTSWSLAKDRIGDSTAIIPISGVREASGRADMAFTIIASLDDSYAHVDLTKTVELAIHEVIHKSVDAAMILFTTATCMKQGNAQK